ncbi:MAG: MurR/RpiR family transcriptional regulator [Christensenellaceae bacterium]|jgi:transcriptional regulator, RpiR family|nr:MurR/RpiR family transcriptional regulator [Clostridium sp.]MCI7375267.1 MurR/RpiR family transcriptional regulator [Christensenellaceae bacterium]PWM47098.1 MAG: MurR/RpiR family transcriptional regulator [Clostridia bacterium]CCX50367.1 transcriptional regulator RpiR family [Clostridium sp. CAG:226]
MRKDAEKTEGSDLLVRLNKNYKTLSKGQKQLAAYITENYDRAAFITASKMGRIVGVSESTVVRFAYALGYDGYPELQKSLQELIRNKLTSVQRIQLTGDLQPNDVLRSVLKSDVSNIRATIDSIDNASFNAAINALLEAKKVYIVGLMSAAPLAQFLAYYLGFVMDNVVMVSGAMGNIYEDLFRISSEDVCIGISFPRYSNRTIDALDFARGKDATIIAITDSVSSPIAEKAEHALIARSDMAGFADSLVAPLSLINAIIVACSLRRREQVSNTLSQLEGIWGSHGVYVTKESGRE